MKDYYRILGVPENAGQKEIKRVGMVIKIKPEFIDEYKALHADSNAGVRDLLTISEFVKVGNDLCRKLRVVGQKYQSFVRNVKKQQELVLR